MCSIDIFKLCADIEKKNKANDFKLFMNKIKSQVLLGSLDDVDDEEVIESPEPSFIKDIIDNLINRALDIVKDECCICIEKKQDMFFNCETCKDGKVCLECMCLMGFDREKYLICPCCRTINWKFQFESLVLSEMQDNPSIDYESPVFKILERNKLILI